MRDTPDTSLLIDVARGHDSAARELWHRFAPGLQRYARTLVPSEADAEDVVQNVFIAISRLAVRDAKRVGDVRAYLVASIRRAALNHLRGMTRRRRRHERFGEQRRDALARLARLDAERAEASERSRTFERLDAAVASLPRRDQEVIALKHVAGMTFDQIALALDANRNTVAARYRRALERLRTTLGDEPASSETPVPLTPSVGDRRGAKRP